MEISRPNACAAELLLLTLAMAGGVLLHLPNLGGTGLQLPFNNWTWAFVALAIGWHVARACWQGRIEYSALTVVIALFALTVLATATMQWLLATPLYPLPYVATLTAIAGLSLLLASNGLQTTHLARIIQLSATLASACGLSFWLLIFTGVVESSPNDNRTFGVFQQPNSFSSLALCGLAALLYLTQQGKGRRWFDLLSAVICAAALLYPQSRTGLLGLIFLALCAIWLLAKDPQARGTVVKIAAATLVGLTLSATILHSSGNNQQMVNKLQDTSGSGRIAIWQITGRMVTEAPLLGAGLGNFRAAFAWEQGKSYQKNGLYAVANVAHPHSEPLLWLAEGGVFLALSLLGLVGWLFWRWHSRKPLQAAEWALLSVITLHNLVEYPSHFSAVHLLVLILVLALLERERYCARHFTFPKAELASGFSIVAGLAAFIFFAANLVTTQQIFKIATTAMDEIARRDALLKLANPFALSQKIEFALYKNQLDLAVNNFDVPLAVPFVTWGESTLQRTPDLEILKGLRTAYHMMGDSESKMRIEKTINYLYPPEKQAGYVEERDSKQEAE